MMPKVSHLMLAAASLASMLAAGAFAQAPPPATPSPRRAAMA